MRLVFPTSRRPPQTVTVLVSCSGHMESSRRGTWCIVPIFHQFRDLTSIRKYNRTAASCCNILTLPPCVHYTVHISSTTLPPCRPLPFASAQLLPAHKLALPKPLLSWNRSPVVPHRKRLTFSCSRKLTSEDTLAERTLAVSLARAQPRAEKNISDTSKTPLTWVIPLVMEPVLGKHGSNVPCREMLSPGRTRTARSLLRTNGVMAPGNNSRELLVKPEYSLSLA